MGSSTKISFVVFIVGFTVIGIILSFLSYLTGLFALLYLLFAYLLFKERSFSLPLRIYTFIYSVIVFFISSSLQAFL